MIKSKKNIQPIMITRNFSTIRLYIGELSGNTEIKFCLQFLPRKPFNRNFKHCTSTSVTQLQTSEVFVILR